MVSMRGALKEAALLVTIVPWGGSEEALASLGEAWRQGLGDGEAVATLRGDGCWGEVSRWERGEEARDAWERFVCSETWRAGATSVTGQPSVFVLASQGTPWAARGACVVACVTRDATVQTREERGGGGRPRMGLPERSELPELPGGRAWPVLGHPGRLLVVGSGAEFEGALEGLEGRWGPWVEEARRWRFSARTGS